jgi:hypothetical protein
MTCASCGATIDAGDRFCPACRMPNLAGRHQPKFGPPDPELPPLVAPRVVAKGERPCPRCEAGVRRHDHYCRSCGFDLSGLAPLPPEGHTVGVWTVPGPDGTDWYRPVGVLSFLTRTVLALSALCAVSVAAMSLTTIRDLGHRTLWPRSAGGLTDWSALQGWGGTLAAAQLVLIVLATLLLIAFTRRAYRNLPALDVVGLRLSRGWAIVGWLIPVVNLFVPKRLLDDTWRASDPHAMPFAEGWQSSSVPVPNQLWLVLGVVALPVVVIVQLQLSIFGSLPPSTASTHSTQTLYLVLALAELLLVLSAAMIGRVVGTIHDRQRDRVAVLGLAAPLAASAPPEEEPVPAEPVTRDPVLVRTLQSDAAGLY